MSGGLPARGQDGRDLGGPGPDLCRGRAGVALIVFEPALIAAFHPAGITRLGPGLSRWGQRKSIRAPRVARVGSSACRMAGVPAGFGGELARAIGPAEVRRRTRRCESFDAVDDGLEANRAEKVEGVLGAG